MTRGLISDRRSFGGVVATGLLMLALAAPVNADPTTYVDPAGVCNGMSPCVTTIQAGVNAVNDPDAADGGAFGVVFVFPGTYDESVDISGINGGTNTGDLSLVTVDPNGVATPGTVTIQTAIGPAFRNSVAPYLGRFQIGGFSIGVTGASGIFVHVRDDVEIHDSSSNDTTVGSGFSVMTDEGHLVVAHSQAIDNAVDGLSGLIAGSITLSNSSFNLNNQFGVSIGLVNPVQVSIAGCFANQNGLSGFNFGAPASGADISESHADGNMQNGFDLDVTGDAGVEAVTADGNGLYGVRIGAGGTIGVTGSTAHDNYTGFNLQATGQVQVSTSDANMNDLHGLFVSTSGSVELMEVGADENASSGVGVFAASIFVGSSHANSNGQTDTGDGFELNVIGAVSVEGTTANGNDTNGFDIDTSGAVTITNSQANANEREGFFFEGSLTQLTMTGCEANMNGVGNGRSGIVTDGTVGGPVSIATTTANSNGFLGFAFEATGPITMMEVRADENQSSGVRFSGGDTASIFSSTANNNLSFGDGFEFQAHGNVTIDGCSAAGNDGAGFDLGADADVAISGSIANLNDFHGFAIADGDPVRRIDLADCTANQNGVHGFVLNGSNLEEMHATRVTARSNGRLDAGGSGLVVTSNVLIQAAVITDSWFQQNARDGIALGSLDPKTLLAHEIAGSVICENEGAGVRSLGIPGLGLRNIELEIDAFGNWWGDASGPTHPGNPGGTGDGIVDGATIGDGIIHFDPWIDTITASAMPGVVSIGVPVNVEFQFSGGGGALFLGPAPGSLIHDLPFTLSTDNGELTASTGTGAMVTEAINLPAGIISVMLVPNMAGTATVMLDGPCGLDAAVTIEAVAADLSIAKSGDADPVTVGDMITYTLVVTNNGPNGATMVTVTDVLPASLTFVSATPSQGTCSEAAGAVTCDLGSLTNGATATLDLVVLTTAVGTVTNTASVTGNPNDPVASNNSADETTTINAPDEPQEPEEPEAPEEPGPGPQEPPASQPASQPSPLADCGAGLCGFGTFGMIPLMSLGLFLMRARSRNHGLT